MRTIHRIDYKIITFEVTMRVFLILPLEYTKVLPKNYTLQTHLIHGRSSIPLDMEVRYELTKFEPHTDLERRKNPKNVQLGILTIDILKSMRKGTSKNFNAIGVDLKFLEFF